MFKSYYLMIQILTIIPSNCILLRARTGIGIIVSILYYTNTLENATKARRVQLFNSIYNGLLAYNSQLNEIQYKWNWTNYDEFLQKYSPETNLEAFNTLDEVGA